MQHIEPLWHLPPELLPEQRRDVGFVIDTRILTLINRLPSLPLRRASPSAVAR